MSSRGLIAGVLHQEAAAYGRCVEYVATDYFDGDPSSCGRISNVVLLPQRFGCGHLDFRRVSSSERDAGYLDVAARLG